MKRLNINDTVKVKLTPHGADIYFHQYDKLRAGMNPKAAASFKPRLPEVDKDGYTRFQLWRFVNLYGPYMALGEKNILVDFNVYIDDDDLEDVEGVS